MAVTMLHQDRLAELAATFPEKFAPESVVFRCVHPGARIFVGTACGEPQHLINSLIDYISSHPKALVDAEITQIWSLGVAPYSDAKFQDNFRRNSFFIDTDSRPAVNSGLADYTPIFLSEVPKLIRAGMLPMEVALIQTSVPDEHGYMSLGISVDIVKAVIHQAKIVIAQSNSYMPRVHGDGFVHIKDVDYIVPFDEPILEYKPSADDAVVNCIGKYVSRLVQDGDTIQVGYGKIPNAILAHLSDKKHLGVHSEFLSDGIVNLMKAGVVDNSLKTINQGKTVASFCMGVKDTYDYIRDNPMVELRTIDYTNNPFVISQHNNMTAINSALEIDLTGQSSAESIDGIFYSGIGGQADFMRGALLASGGKTILALPSTARNAKISRIVPFLKQGSGVTLNRGDVHFVVTEYGIAYLQGKNIRERAMSLIAIAHPDFRPWLIEQAKEYHLIFDDQAFVPGKNGEYPEELETHRVTNTGLGIFLRPVKICDEPLLKEFYYSLSRESMTYRFASSRSDMPHKRLQDYVAINHSRERQILAIIPRGVGEVVIGIGGWYLNEKTQTAEVAFAVRDEDQNRGIGTELLTYLTYLARREGILGFYAEVLRSNDVMLHIFKKAGFVVAKSDDYTMQKLTLNFREEKTPENI